MWAKTEIKNPQSPYYKAMKALLGWAHLESNQAPTDYESVALTE